jgi:uncharacterized radical SAM protein YgiQ
VVVISGDAYVDHPSFPTAVITRLLQKCGLRVAVIAQPDWRSLEDFRVFGRPELFFAVTAGAMDSMVANYTSMRLPRHEDRLSPGGKAGMRPKRAVGVYCQRLREAFGAVSIVIGGIEASLRRFSHFDFWENRIRDSILIDSGADLLVYGMAETALVGVVDWFRSSSARDGQAPPRLPQTCIKVPAGMGPEAIGADYVRLPGAQECRENPARFMELAAILDQGCSGGARAKMQSYPKGDVIEFPPASGSDSPEINVGAVFNRRGHPLYDEPVPGLLPVQFSVISHRGCLGTCTFCALAMHQGRRLRSRDEKDILAEVSGFPAHPDFHGTVPDLGGPSVNMYGWDLPGHRPGLEPLAEVLRRVRAIPGIKHVFLGSGLRYDLIRDEEWGMLEEIVRFHVSGQLKVAPEHVDPRILTLMRKAPGADFAGFIRRFNELTERLHLKRFLVPYFMTAFPGTTTQDEKIAAFTRIHHLVHQQIQEFTPTPGTLAAAMFFAGLDPEGRQIPVPREDAARKKGRAKIQGPSRRGRS